MALPEFDSRGDLPEGVHRVSFDEVVRRFGRGTPRRQLVTSRLTRIYELARQTGNLERFVIFGSYLTAKPEPNDDDIILVMRDDFLLSECDAQSAVLLSSKSATGFGGQSLLDLSIRSVAGDGG
jgi:hypothetical protein